MLEEKLTEWVHKVLTAYETAGMTDILQMIVDVDRIIAEAFGHTPVLEETQLPAGCGRDCASSRNPLRVR